MSTIDERALKMLEDLQSAVKGLKADVAGVKSDVGNLKTDVAVLRSGQKALEVGQKDLAVKVEAIHAYQKQAHNEIMGHLIGSNEMNGQS